MDWICKIPLLATLKSYQKSNFKFDLTIAYPSYSNYATKVGEPDA
jgi:hypothetical protein